MLVFGNNDSCLRTKSVPVSSPYVAHALPGLEEDTDDKVIIQHEAGAEPPAENSRNFSRSIFVYNSAHAQKTIGGIEGTVIDSSGTIAHNAWASATDETTGEKIQAVSDQQGFYRLLEVHPDPYSVTVEAEGFKQLSIPHVLALISRYQG